MKKENENTPISGTHISIVDTVMRGKKEIVIIKTNAFKTTENKTDFIITPERKSPFEKFDK